MTSEPGCGAFRAAVVQLTSTGNQDANIAAATEWIERAAAAGAQLVATPENTPHLGSHAEKLASAERLDGPICAHFSSLARSLGITLLLGSFAERGLDPRRCFNTTVVFGPDGKRIAAYRKIHLFDVDVDERVRFRESDTVERGDTVVVAETALAPIGLSICYDLRFGGLYRRLVDAGATVIAVPSAFTATTGREHWEVLLRARAIETQCWVIAPAQVGRHDDDGIRESWGHATIVDPWGRVVADVGEEPGMTIAEIDLDEVERVRTAMPVRAQRGVF